MCILNISTSVAMLYETLIIHFTFRNCHTRPYVKPFKARVTFYHGIPSWHPACAVYTDINLRFILIPHLPSIL